MLFWIKNVFLIVFLGGAAAYLLLGDELSFLGGPDEEPVGRVTKPTKKTETEIKAEIEESKDAFTMTTSGAATGLSNFYGKVKEELLGNSKTMGDGYVIKVEPSIYTVDEQLIRRGQMVTPGSENFAGGTLNIRFRIGQTIRAQLAAAAEKEGMELMWRLDRDYIIKHYFQVDSNLLSALGVVAGALNTDFEKDVLAYYCYRQRAVIITHELTDFMQSNCRQATSKS